ncbi:hypothetical protein [Methylobacterium soli]|uniref:Uncharacterized protein n=1 Tax=Methylobacterium soli TaxID=553447 RepID=A0A6L3SVI7_9HYPH|nr:hypothetical protein [Methylobacterium soli]KAB1075412.1 hypothetical protein F6X53_24910 [Methylobacterium soli]GJE41306.1 hypothetical protein AEGHOMDF_0468 [Methylobacterium soli]
MSIRRQISWTAATRDMRNDRTIVAAPATLAERIARQHAREENVRAYRAAQASLAVAAAQPLASAGGYDRAAIMTLANAIVRERMTARLGQSYRALIGKALKQAWSAARDARRAAAH